MIYKKIWVWEVLRLAKNKAVPDVRSIRDGRPKGQIKISTSIIGREERNVKRMNVWYEQAAEKLDREKKAGKYDRYAAIMKDRTCDVMKMFCRQDAEFAQAVVQSGTFEECMKDVAKNCGNGIPDEVAYGRAVQFYFPGAKVRFHLTVDLCGSIETEVQENTQPIRSESKILSLDDFL